MLITCIRPSLMGERAADAMEPLAFAILAGLTPPEAAIELWDERVEPVPLDRPASLVAITVETYTARRAYQIAAAYRRRGVPVVLGGYHPTFLPAEALAHADAVVLGDAETLWPQVVADARAGRLAPRYQASGQPDLAGLRYERAIFAGKRYTRVAPVQFSRGCRFACDFCSIHAFYGSSVRHRPIDEVVAEIQALGRRYILIVDDNIFVDVAAASALFEALIPLNIRWGCQVSIDVTRDESLLDLMARSGCIAALVGFESLSERNLSQMKKRWNVKGGDYATAIARLQRRGIMVYGSFVFGYDDDTVDSFGRTAAFARDSGMFLVNFSALQPTPGSGLYDRLAREQRLLYDHWWVDPTYRYGAATFQPARMSAEQLTAGCRQARAAFYAPSSILRRAWAPANRHPARLGIYLGANLIARRELAHKLGRPLGRSDTGEPTA